jgi:hypothetical protein
MLPALMPWKTVRTGIHTSDRFPNTRIALPANADDSAQKIIDPVAKSTAGGTAD